MKHIEKEELYQHLSEFLKTKGVELKEGSYTNFIHNGCKVLADAINLSQQGLRRAKSGLDQKLDRMRQVIHHKTAPKPRAKPPAETARAAGPAAQTKPPAAPPAQTQPPPRAKARKTPRAKAPKKAAPRPKTRR